MSAILLDKKPKTTLKHTSYDSSYIRGHVRTVMAENITNDIAHNITKDIKKMSSSLTNYIIRSKSNGK